MSTKVRSTQRLASLPSWRSPSATRIGSSSWSSLARASVALTFLPAAPGYRSQTPRSTCSRCGAAGLSWRGARANSCAIGLSDNSVLDLVAALRTIAEQNSPRSTASSNSYFRNRDDLEAVSRKELMRRIRDGVVTVLDVRPEDEYALGHLPGAMNVPRASSNGGAPGSTARARTA